MIVRPARVGARGTDSVQEVAEPAALKAAGVDFCVRYLHSATSAEVANIVAAGLAFMPVTFAGAYDGTDAAAQCKALGLPAGCTAFLDLEGQKAWAMDPAELMAKINAWADAVAAGGFMPGLYCGVPQPLTSAELYSVRVVRYWRGQGRITDRTGALAEPNCGWCMTQTYPSAFWAGVWADADFVGQDYSGRVPAWAVAV
jgi:hypothetical protein